MIKPKLKQLYEEHSGKVSDKWGIYLVEYGRVFEEYRDEPIRLLEIGVQNGGSLEIWSKFFVNAQKFVGCDINTECARLVYEDPRVAVVVGDANSDAVQSIVVQHANEYDVIIDDGSHSSSDIVKSFARYFPLMADGGVFVAEDLHCSYWAEFEGGLFDPFSSIAFFKRLSDIVNHEHWGIAKSRSELLRGFFIKYDFQIDEDVLTHIHSIEFINSMCVIRKKTPKVNTLGARFMAGLDETIVPGGIAQQSSSSPTPSQVTNAWTARMIPPDEDVLRLERSLVDRNEQISLLTASIDEILASRDEILASTSWQITEPLRFVTVQVKKILRSLGI